MSIETYSNLCRNYEYIECLITGGAHVFFIISDDIILHDEMAWAFSRHGFTSKVFRGKKMRDWQGVYDEVGAALQFPDYFGENSGAFNECITDMSWMEQGRGYVYTISEVHKVFMGYPSDIFLEKMKGFVHAFTRAAEFWRAPELSGEMRDIPDPTLFRVVLSAPSDQIESVKEIWGCAGVKLGEFVDLKHIGEPPIDIEELDAFNTRK